MMDSTQIPLKMCCTCHQPFPATLDYFHAYKQSEDSLSPRCKPCARQKLQQSRAKRRAHGQAMNRQEKKDIPVAEGCKRCFKCKGEFPATLEFFYANKGRRDNLSSRCKQCQWMPVERPPEGMKRCTICKRDLPATTDYFHHNACAHGKYKLVNRCKDCFNLSGRHALPDGFKRCRKCKELFPATSDYFDRSSTEKYGLGGTCKTCRKQEREQYPEGTYPPDGAMKTCTRCQQSFPATLHYFACDANKKDHLRTMCKECTSNTRQTEAFKAASRARNYAHQTRIRALPGSLTAQVLLLSEETWKTL
jgi:hypothetical protein